MQKNFRKGDSAVLARPIPGAGLAWENWMTPYLGDAGVIIHVEEGSLWADATLHIQPITQDKPEAVVCVSFNALDPIPERGDPLADDPIEMLTFGPLGGASLGKVTLRAGGTEHLGSATISGVKDAKPTNPKNVVGIRKAPMSTVSAAVLAEVGVAMLEGAAKYGRHNYRCAGVRASVYYDATMRHLMEWWEGIDIDAASGMHHITKAITSLVVLRDSMIQGMCTDDRPPRSAEFYGRLNALAGEILDRHAAVNPYHYTIVDTPEKDS